MITKESPLQIFSLELTQDAIRLRNDGYVNVLDLERYIPRGENFKMSWANFWSQAIDMARGLARHHSVSVDNMIQVETTAYASMARATSPPSC